MSNEVVLQDWNIQQTRRRWPGFAHFVEIFSSQFSKFLFLLFLFKFLFNILWIVANLIQIHTLELKGSQNLIQFWIRHMNVQRCLTAICTYFTRWLIRKIHLARMILYDLSKPRWRVGLGAGFGVGHSYKFIRIDNSSNTKKKIVRVRSYEFVRISHLVKYVRLAVRSSFNVPQSRFLPHLYHCMERHIIWYLNVSTREIDIIFIKNIFQ